MEPLLEGQDLRENIMTLYISMMLISIQNYLGTLLSVIKLYCCVLGYLIKNFKSIKIKVVNLERNIFNRKDKRCDKFVSKVNC